MDLGERPPVEGVEEEAEPGQSKGAESSEHSWSPNEEFIKALLEMGISQNAAEKVDKIFNKLLSLLYKRLVILY